MSLTLDDVLENWAAWYRNPQWDVNDPKHTEDLRGALAVEILLERLHWKERNAVNAVYRKKRVDWTEGALFTGMKVLEEGLKERKILT